MAEALENSSFFDKGIFHVLQDTLHLPLKSCIIFFIVNNGVKIIHKKYD